MTAPIPNTFFTFPNGGLGMQPSDPSNVIAVVGAASLGTSEVPTSLGGRVSNVVSGFGYGPGPSLVAALIRSGATVIFTKCDSDPQPAGTVVESGNVGTSGLTVTGDGLDGYFVVVTILNAGTAVTDTDITFSVSLDGGITESGAITLPVTGIYTGLVATTGLTLTFSAGTLVATSTYSFPVPPPVVAAADAVAALTALKLSNFSYGLVHVAAPFDATDCTTITAEVANIVARKKFTRVILESEDVADGDDEADWMTALQEDFIDFASDIATVGAGYILVLDGITGTHYAWRNIAYLATVRACQVAVQRDLAAVADGPLTPWLTEGQGSPGVFADAPVSGKFVHDEAAVPGLNDARFMTIRSLVGYPSLYITNPNVMCGPTSDYDLLQFGRVADKAARFTNTFFTQQLSADVDLNPSTGKILEVVAKGLEQGNNTACAGMLAEKNVSALQTQVARDDDIITTRELTVQVQMVPKGYLKVIRISIGFVPSIAA